MNPITERPPQFSSWKIGSSGPCHLGSYPSNMCKFQPDQDTPISPKKKGLGQPWMTILEVKATFH